MNILFIGNSYTYFFDLPTLFADLCRANGHDIRVDSVTAGGRELHECLTEFHNDLNVGDPLGKKISELLEEVEYDVLILQEQSCHRFLLLAQQVRPESPAPLPPGFLFL